MSDDPKHVPQSEWPAYKPATCECGHVLGDHRCVTAGLYVVNGVCFRCDCPKFEEKP